MDTNLSAEFINQASKHFGDMVGQMSIANVTVPRIDAYDDVFEFVNEYEVAVATLPEDQQVKLLVKSFPKGMYRAWYETELSELIKSPTTTWKDIKRKIIKRYSDTDDENRHFKKLSEVKFVDNGKRKLFDFVEEVLYSFRRSFPEVTDEARMIEYVKTRIPEGVRKQLVPMTDYNYGKTLEEFKRGIRQFDLARSGLSSDDEPSKKADKSSGAELVSLLKELVKGFKEEGEQTRKVVVAALQSRPEYYGSHYNQQGGPSQGPSYQRPKSPNAYNNNYNNQQYAQRNDNNYYSQRSNSRERPADGMPSNKGQYRPCSPHPNKVYSPANLQNNLAYSPKNTPEPVRQSRFGNPMQDNSTQQQSSRQVQQFRAFNDEDYFAKYGRPDKPCPRCNNGFHYEQHCVYYLN